MLLYYVQHRMLKTQQQQQKTERKTISNYITLSTQNVVLVYSNGMLKYLEKSLPYPMSCILSEFS